MLGVCTTKVEDYYYLGTHDPLVTLVGSERRSDGDGAARAPNAEVSVSRRECQAPWGLHRGKRRATDPK